MKVPAPTGKVHLLEPSVPSSKGSLMMEEKDGDRSAAAAALQSIRWGQSSEGSNSSGDDLHAMSTSDIISLYSKNSSSNNYPGLRSMESLLYSDYAPVYDLLRESHLSSSATTLVFPRSRFSSSDEDCRLAEVNPVSHDIFATANRRNGENSPSSQSCNQFLQPMLPPIFPLEPKDDPPPSDVESGVPPCGHNHALRYPRGNGNVKLLCSFGGKILPRPGDGKLRYVGGETRIISVPVNISYAEFTCRLTESYGTALFLKYQLPDEELDALISVSSDDDLQNMMEECCKIEYSGVGGGGGAIRSPLRIFPFPQDSERSDHLEEIFTCRNPEQSYIYAINGISDRFLMESVENGNEQWGDEVLLGFDPSMHSNNQAEGSAIGCSQDSMRVVVPPNPHLGGWIKSGNTPLATSSSTPSSPPLAQRPIVHVQQGDLNMHPSMERLGHRAGIHNYGDGHLQRFEDRDHSSHLADTLKYSDPPPIELAVSRSGQRRLFGEPPVPNPPVQQRCYSPSHTQRPDNSHHFWSQHQIGGGDRHPPTTFQEVRQRQDVPRQYLVDMYAPREFPHRLHHFQVDQHSVEPDDYLGSSYLPTSMCLQGFASTPPHLIEIAQPSSPRQQQQQPPPSLVESKYVPIQQQHMLRGEPLHSSRGGGSQAIRSWLPNSPPRYHVEPNYVDGGGGRATPKHLPEPLAAVSTPKYSFYNAVPELDTPGAENFQSASTIFHSRGIEKDRQASGQQTMLFSQTNQRSTPAHHEQQQRRQFPEQIRFNNQDRLEQYDVGSSRSHRMYRHNRETVEDGVDMVSGFSQTHEKGSDESLQLMQAREVDMLRYQKMNRTEVTQNDRYPDQSMRMPAQQGLVNRSYSRSQQRVFGRYTGKAEMQGEADLYNPHMQAASELPSTVGVVDIWSAQEGTHLLDMHEQDKHLDYSEGLFNGLPLAPLDLIEVNSDSRFTESKALSNAFPSAMTAEAPSNELESGQVPSYIKPPATFSSIICPWDCKSSKSSLVVEQDNDTNPLALPIYDQSPISSIRASPSRDFPLIPVDSEKKIHDNTAKDASAIEMSFIGCLAEDMASCVLDSCSKDPVSEVDAIIKDASIESPDELLTDNSIKEEVDNSQCRIELGDASSACIAVGGGEGAKQGSLNIQSPLASKKLQQQLEDDNSALEKALPADLNSSGEKKTQKVDIGNDNPIDGEGAKQGSLNIQSPLASKKLQQQLEDDNSALEKALPADLNSSGEKKTQKVDIGNDNPIDGDEKCSKNTATGALPEALSLQTIKNADLEEVRELGSGTFGTVFYGKWRGSDVAIKRIKSSCFSGRPSEQERLITDFWKEACTLSQLHHPNIVAFYGVVSDEPGGTLATVTEYMVNGSLKQVLQKKDRTIDRRKRLLIAMDAAFGMEYLHSKNIVHFDLKSENLLVNMRDPHRPICKVGDFGLSKVKHHTLVSGGVRGTLPWMAPELLSGKSSKVTEKIDVYSFGIVMWELLTGEEPYADMHCGEIIGGIVSNTLRPPIPTWCDPAWRSLMQRCWVADPKERPSFAEAVSELRAIAASMNLK